MINDEEYIKSFLSKLRDGGKVPSKEYARAVQKEKIRLQKIVPNFYNAVFNKKYILPTFRQQDYPNQDLCNQLLFDLYLATITRKKRLDGVVQAQCVSLTRQLEANRPTFFLEKELAKPMIKTKLPDEFYLTDVKWRYPAFRVYLPKNSLSLNRDNELSDLMYLDITKVEAETPYQLPFSIWKELKEKIGVEIPGFKEIFSGFQVTGVLDFDSPLSCLGYAGTSKLDGMTMKRLMDVVHAKDLNANLPSDEIDKLFINQMLALAINILIYLSSYPLEYELGSKRDIIRPPKMEGKRHIAGLYKARFVGESQLRPYHPSKPKTSPVAPTGVQMAAQARAGHWKRVWYGPRKTENRLQWIPLYHTHGPEPDPETLTDVKPS